jgi:hypothetical protein
MRASIISVAALAALAATPVIAAQWLSIWRDFDSVDDHKYEVLLDLSSIGVNAASPNIRTATVKYVRTTPRARDSAADRFSYSITIKSFDCQSQRIRLDHSEVHFPDGTLQYIDTDKNQGTWHAARSPVARQLLSSVCAATS